MRKEDTPSPDLECFEEPPDATVSVENGRSRGKRRTAREIANMFEQLKRRHVARKREWAEEKDVLLKKLQMAEGSKRVLTELKLILENLREELRREERKRLQMELDHVDEKNTWELQKAELQKRIEEHARHESDKDGEGLKKMSEKILEQTKLINDLKGNEIELRRQVLENDKLHLREKRELQLELEMERTKCRRKEWEFNAKLRQMQKQKSSASSLSPSSGDTPNPLRDFIHTEATTYRDSRHEESKDHEVSPYGNFERKVDDALREIEIIKADWSDSKQESDFHQTTSSDFKKSATPSPLLENAGSISSNTAPWRKQHRPLTQKTPSTDANQISSSGSYQSRSPIDASISLISSNTSRNKQTPNPDRKFKKISGKGNDINLVDSNTNVDISNEDIKLETVSQSYGDDSTESTLSNKEKATSAKLHNIPNRSKKSNTAVGGGKVRRPSDKAEADNLVKQNINKAARSTSPRLPKLHQQLLFKRDPPLKLQEQKPVDTNFVSSADNSFSDKCLPMPTNYYVSSRGQCIDQATEEVKRTSLPRQKDSNYHSSRILIDAGESVPPTTNRDTPPLYKDNAIQAPAVHPKPKVAIHTDGLGNIIHVAPISDTGAIPQIKENIQQPEKQHSIAERVGKAGRDWIRKKLHFKDKVLDVNEGIESGTLTKKKGKQKQRRQSAMMRKRDSASLTTSDDTGDESSSRKREAFLRRHKRKGKGNTVSNKENESTSKPKKYTRSKTEGSPKDMKRFLSKFKTQQHTVKKQPSIVQKFEQKLKENDASVIAEGIRTSHSSDHRTKNAEGNYARCNASSGTNYVDDNGEATTESKEPKSLVEANPNYNPISNEGVKHSSDDDSTGERERISVSRLVDRFSTHYEDGSKPKPLRSSMRRRSNNEVNIRNSLTWHGANVGDETSRTNRLSWYDRVTAISENEAGEEEAPAALAKKFESLSNFWEDKRCTSQCNEIPDRPERTKFMTDEMQQKKQMLEGVLSKGPKKTRKYRRADTQPVCWKSESEEDSISATDESSSSSSLDCASPSKTSGKTSDLLLDIGNEETYGIHETIPLVTSKFTKPSKPGRMPSRWAK